MFDNSIAHPDNKERIAVVVVGYNRLSSIKRLLKSLVNAQYDHSDIPLVISIDCSGDTALYDYVQKFEWKHGSKYVNIQEERLGLKKHVIHCGDLTKYFKAVILLEDDIFVSEYFYQYVEKAVAFYGNDDRIGGISLYQNEMKGTLPITFMINGGDTYLKQSPASWGECWTDTQWNGFKKWYDAFSDERFGEIDMPEYIKAWKKAWSKYYMAYLIDSERYFVFPYVSLTTCFGDAGEHSSIPSTIGQANLLCGKKEYHFHGYEDMIRYDSYGTNENIYDWLGISKDDLCVDWYGTNNNYRKARFLLTTASLNLRIIKHFGLLMHPIELNVKYNIEGNDIFLYDTINGEVSSVGKKTSLSETYYYIRSMDVRLAAKYVCNHYYSKIKGKLGIK